MFVEYRNLYHLGYLHRDINPGNIIAIDPESRKKGIIEVDIHPACKSQVLDGCMLDDETPVSCTRSPNTLDSTMLGDGTGPDATRPTKEVAESARGMLIDTSLAVKKGRSNPASGENPGLTVWK